MACLGIFSRETGSSSWASRLAIGPDRGFGIMPTLTMKPSTPRRSRSDRFYAKASVSASDLDSTVSSFTLGIAISRPGSLGPILISAPERFGAASGNRRTGPGCRRDRHGDQGAVPVQLPRSDAASRSGRSRFHGKLFSNARRIGGVSFSFSPPSRRSWRGCFPRFAATFWEGEYLQRSLIRVWAQMFRANRLSPRLVQLKRYIIWSFGVSGVIPADTLPLLLREMSRGDFDFVAFERALAREPAPPCRKCADGHPIHPFFGELAGTAQLTPDPWCSRRKRGYDKGAMAAGWIPVSRSPRRDPCPKKVHAAAARTNQTPFPIFSRSIHM